MSAPRPRLDLADALARLPSIPVFPLPQVVLFPRAALPLHVFEPRYRAMLADCLRDHGAIAIAQLGAGEDDEGRPRFAALSGGGVVVEHQPLPDGRSNIVVLGQARLRRAERPRRELGERPYRRARESLVPEVEVAVPEAERTALVAAATMFAAEIERHDPHFVFRVPSAAEAGALADLCAAQLVIDAAARQAILEELDPRRRVERVLRQLALQHGAMLGDATDRSALN